MCFLLVSKVELPSLRPVNGSHCIPDTESLVEWGVTVCPRTPTDGKHSHLSQPHSAKTQGLQSRQCSARRHLPQWPLGAQQRDSTRRRSSGRWETSCCGSPRRRESGRALGQGLLSTVAPDPASVPSLLFSRWFSAPVCSKVPFGGIQTGRVTAQTRLVWENTWISKLFIEFKTPSSQKMSTLCLPVKKGKAIGLYVFNSSEFLNCYFNFLKFFSVTHLGKNSY